MNTTRLFPTLLLCASILSTLTGCAESINVAPKLPEEPAGLTACTDEAIPAIPGAAGTSIPKSLTAGVIGDQRTSAVFKDKCSHDWRDFYGELRTNIGGKPAVEEPSLLTRAKGVIDGLLP